jgi:hypothetical protein
MAIKMLDADTVAFYRREIIESTEANHQRRKYNIFKYWLKAPEWTASEAAFLLLHSETPHDPPENLSLTGRELGHVFRHFELFGLLEDARITDDGEWEVDHIAHSPMEWVECFSELQPLDDMLLLAIHDLAEERGQSVTVNAENGTKNRWPWGEHTTDLLGHLAAAGERFWANYDPSDNGTAPTNDMVEKWLIDRNR